MIKESLSQYKNDDVMAALRDVTHLRAKVDEFASYNVSNSGMLCNFDSLYRAYNFEKKYVILICLLYLS